MQDHHAGSDFIIVFIHLLYCPSFFLCCKTNQTNQYEIKCVIHLIVLLNILGVMIDSTILVLYCTTCVYKDGKKFYFSFFNLFFYILQGTCVCQCVLKLISFSIYV